MVISKTACLYLTLLPTSTGEILSLAQLILKENSRLICTTAIQKITPLAWNDAKLPKLLRQRRTTLPTPDHIRLQMHQAWGFDFYLPSKLMLLRFDRTFHDRYIKGTSRHATFKPISYQGILQLIPEQVIPVKHRETLLKILQNRPQDDACYTVIYRDGDPNVGLRLRAWRPKVEVLLPWELRQEITKEVQAEWHFYQN